MKTLWNFTDHFKLGRSAKRRIYLTLLILITLALGAAVWLAVGRLFLPGIDWLLVFMGCPAILIGFFGGIVYLYNHEFTMPKRYVPAPRQASESHPAARLIPEKP